MPKDDQFDLLRLFQSLGPMKLGSPFQKVKRRGPLMFDQYEAERDAASGQPKSKPSRKPLIYTLTIDCQWGPTLSEPCQRVVEVKSDMTLLDLHDVIQKAVKFDDDHCFEFFIGRHERDRKICFGDGDEGPTEGDFDAYELSRIWPLPKSCFLFYWFDFGDDWKFRIRKGKSMKPPAKGVRYPRLIKEVGPNPVQYPDCE